MKILFAAAAMAVCASGVNAKDLSNYQAVASVQEIQAYMDGPVTKCLIKARNTYATCIANASNDAAKDKCLKALQKKILQCQGAK